MEYSKIFTSSFHNFIYFDLGEIIFENFNIFENNIISVELAKGLLGYYTSISTFPPPSPASQAQNWTILIPTIFSILFNVVKGGGGGGFFWPFSFVPNMFPSSSQYVP
jgi:hypothetical protein